MANASIARNTWIVVADGGRALVLRNDGDEAAVRLAVVRKYGQDTPPTREIGADKPGRAHSGVGPHRSAMDQTDYHQQAEARMMKQVATELGADLRRHSFAELIIAAAPGALGMLRRELSAEVKKAVVAEVPKDFTHFHLPDLDEALPRALKAADHTFH